MNVSHLARGISLVLPVITLITRLNIEKQVLNNRDFPSGAVVKNLPASAGDTGSSPGPGRSHMLQSN